MSQRWQVEVREGEGGAVLRYEFTELPITIGRHEGNDVRLSRPFVSGFHARIEQSGAGLCVVDVSRTNGIRARLDGGRETRVARDRPQPLSRCGDEFAIGAYRIRVSAAPAAPPLAALSEPLSLPALTSADSGRGPADSLPAAALSLPSLPGAIPSLSSLPVAPPSPLRSASPARAGGERRAAEAAALAELEELLRAIGLDQRIDTPERVSALVRRLQLALELACRGLARLHESQRRCASALRLARLAPERELDGHGAEQLLRRWLDERMPLAELRASVTAPFHALARHQVAMLEGMIEGAAALVKELSPERIEARIQGGSAWPGLGKWRWLRRAYREQHAQLSRKDGVLSLLFGDAFRAAYAAYLSGERSQRGSGSARRRGELR